MEAPPGSNMARLRDLLRGEVVQDYSAILAAVPGNNSLSQDPVTTIRHVMTSHPPPGDRKKLERFSADVLTEAFSLQPGRVEDRYDLLVVPQAQPSDRKRKKAKKSKRRHQTLEAPPEDGSSGSETSLKRKRGQEDVDPSKRPRT